MVGWCCFGMIHGAFSVATGQRPSLPACPQMKLRNGLSANITVAQQVLAERSISEGVVCIVSESGAPQTKFAENENEPSCDTVCLPDADTCFGIRLGAIPAELQHLGLIVARIDIDGQLLPLAFNVCVGTMHHVSGFQKTQDSPVFAFTFATPSRSPLFMPSIVLHW